MHPCFVHPQTSLILERNSRRKGGKSPTGDEAGWPAERQRRNRYCADICSLLHRVRTMKGDILEVGADRQTVSRTRSRRRGWSPACRPRSRPCCVARYDWSGHTLFSFDVIGQLTLRGAPPPSSTGRSDENARKVADQTLSLSQLLLPVCCPSHLSLIFRCCFFALLRYRRRCPRLHPYSPTALTTPS